MGIFARLTTMSTMLKVVFGPEPEAHFPKLHAPKLEHHMYLELEELYAIGRIPFTSMVFKFSLSAVIEYAVG